MKTAPGIERIKRRLMNKGYSGKDAEAKALRKWNEKQERIKRESAK